jgi:hypothetical protein
MKKTKQRGGRAFDDRDGGSLAAHHSLSQFDTTTAVRVKGLSAVWSWSILTALFLWIKKVWMDRLNVGRGRARGHSTRETSFNKESLKVGDTIEACGYVTKEGVDPQQTLSKLPDNSKNTSVRLMDAELLVMPGGQIQKWSDYGQHLCLGADYHDFH